VGTVTRPTPQVRHAARRTGAAQRHGVPLRPRVLLRLNRCRPTEHDYTVNLASTFLYMTNCVKPLRHLATSSTKSSRWSVLIGRAGRLSTKSHLMSKWFHALCHIHKVHLYYKYNFLTRASTTPHQFWRMGLVQGSLPYERLGARGTFCNKKKNVCIVNVPARKSTLL
jgi:hypothetical protein